MRRNSIVLILATALLIAPPADAQLTGAVDVGGLGQSVDGGWLSRWQTIPTVRFDQAHASVQAAASFMRQATALRLDRTSMLATLRSNAIGPIAASLTTELNSASAASLAPATASLDGALSARRGASGVWIGAGASRLTPRVDSPAGAAAFSMGGWRSLGSLIVSIAAQEHRLDLSPSSRVSTYPDSTYSDSTGWVKFTHFVGNGRDSSASRQRWTDVDARLQWAFGRLALSGRVTVPTRRDSLHRATSGEVAAAVQIGSRASLLVSGGLTPAIGLVGSSPSRFASFGVRLTRAPMANHALPPAVRPVASGFVVEESTNDTRRIVVHVPAARVVELSGDFTAWSPVALRQTASDQWETVVRLTPGTHHVNLRVNGDAWTPPPGLPAVDDGFDGRVGLLVVR